MSASTATPSHTHGLQGWAHRHRFALLSAAGLLLTIIVLWLPTGWRAPDFWDVWMFITQFDQGHSLLFYPTFPTRPLTSLPFLLAYLIDPASFLGFNLLLAALLLARGALTIAIVRLLLPGQPAVAFLCGAFSLLHPADTGLFYLSALNIHLSVVSFELAVLLLLIFWTTRRRRALVTSMLALIVTLGLYEAALPLIFATPLLLWWTDRRLSRRLFAVSTVWIGIAGLVLAVMAIAVQTGTAAYQSSIQASGSLVSQIAFGVLFAYAQALQSGFAEGAALVSRVAQGGASAPLLALAVCAAAVCGVLVWRLAQDDAGREAPQRRAAELAGLAALAIPLGYLVYMPTYLFFVSFRTMYFSGWAAAIALGCALGAIAALPVRRRLAALVTLGVAVMLLRAALSLLGRADSAGFLPLALLILAVIALSATPRPWSFVLPAGLLLCVSALYLLEQHRMLDQAGRAQTAQLTQIVQQAPAIAPETRVLLLNQTGPLPRGATPLNTFPANFVFSDLFDNALNVIYRDARLQGRMCSSYTFPIAEPDCVFTAEGVWTADPHSAWDLATGRQLFPYERIIAFAIDSTGAVTLLQRIPAEYAAGLDTSAYQPAALIDRSAPPPPRALTMLPP